MGFRGGGGQIAPPPPTGQIWLTPFKNLTKFALTRWNPFPLTKAKQTLEDRLFKCPPEQSGNRNTDLEH